METAGLLQLLETLNPTLQTETWHLMKTPEKAREVQSGENELLAILVSEKQVHVELDAFLLSRQSKLQGNAERINATVLLRSMSGMHTYITPLSKEPVVEREAVWGLGHFTVLSIPRLVWLSDKTSAFL